MRIGRGRRWGSKNETLDNDKLSIYIFIVIYSAIETKDTSINISDEIQKILKSLVQGEVIPDMPEQILPTSGKRGGAKNRPPSPSKEKEDPNAP